LLARLRQTGLDSDPGAAIARARVISALGPLIALLLASFFFTIRTDRFLTTENWSLITQQVAVVGILAIGQTLIILTAGIDLSVGAVMALGTIVMTRLAVTHGLNPFLAIALGIGVCLAFGVLNGVLVTALRLPPFIVTLGTLNIAFALTHITSNEETIANLPDPLVFFGDTFRFAGTTITYGAVLAVALTLVTWFVLTRTIGGRHVYATGNNPDAARLAGVRTRRVLLSVYAIAGLLDGIAALVLVGRTGVGDPQAGQSSNLDSITAVVVGGTSLFGGRGSVLGTLVGTLIVGIFRNGLTLLGVAAIYQFLITGVLVIVAVGVDQLSRRTRA
jgi:fructose transport system permease protein